MCRLKLSAVGGVGGTGPPGVPTWPWCRGSVRARQVGRAEGMDIVQTGTDARGLATRWRFTEITPDSFHWLGERRRSDGDDWLLEVEFFARRTAASDTKGGRA